MKKIKKQISNKTNQSTYKATMKVGEVNHNKTRNQMQEIRGENDKMKFEDSPWL